MKRILYLPICFIFIIALAACGVEEDNRYTISGSVIIVIEKGYSDDYSEMWILAYDPYNSHTSTREHPIKITTEIPSIWNLIEVDREYSASYYNTLEDPETWHLNRIAHFHEEDNLR